MANYRSHSKLEIVKIPEGSQEYEIVSEIIEFEPEQAEFAEYEFIEQIGEEAILASDDVEGYDQDVESLEGDAEIKEEDRTLFIKLGELRGFKRAKKQSKPDFF